MKGLGICAAGFICILFSLPTTSHAATYYVNNSSSTYSGTQGIYNPGNNSTGNGSLSAPWATMIKAESTASNTDTVYVATGTYIEDHASTHSMASSKGISWNADGEVIVRAASSTQYVLAFLSNSSSAASFNGFTFDGENEMTQIIYLATNASNKSVINSQLINPKTGADFIANGGVISGLVLTGNTYIDNGTNARTAVYLVNGLSGDTIIDDNAFFFTGTTSAIWVGGSGAGNVFFRDNTITSTQNPNRRMVAFTGVNMVPVVSDNTILNSSPSFNTSLVTFRDQKNIVFENNTVAATSTNSTAVIGLVEIGNTTGCGGSCGIPSIKNNLIEGTQHMGQLLLVGTDTSSSYDNVFDGALIEGNTIHGCIYFGACDPSSLGTHGLEFGYNKNGTIARNWVEGSGYGIVIKGNADTFTAGGVFSNVVKDASIESIRIKGQNDVRVENNTLIVSEGNNSTNGHVYVTINAQSNNVPSNGTLVKNNILFTQGGSKTINVDASSTNGLVIDNNLHFMETGIASIVAYVGTTTYTTWDTWQTAGYDIHGVNANPQFVNVENIFRLQNTSPAVNAGTTTSYSTDILNNNIYGSIRDIGAYEYQSVTPTSSFTSSATDLTVQFTDTSVDSDGTITSWLWDFGDSQTSTSQNPSHIYASDGSYDVDLTVTDNHGEQDTDTDSVSVTQGTSGGSSSSGGGRSHRSTTATTTPATTTTALEARIAELRAELARLQGSGTGTSTPFIRNLNIGYSGSDVQLLQRFLNDRHFTVSLTGAGSAGNESTYFGDLTREALARFQFQNNISPAVGFFGPITRGIINSQLGS